jgi:hypothetical protein
MSTGLKSVLFFFFFPCTVLLLDLVTNIPTGARILART